MKTIKKFISYYKPYKKMFFMDIFCALILSIIDLVFPILVRYIINDVYNKSKDQIIKYIVLIGTVFLLMYIIKYFCQYYIISWGHIMGTKIEADMRTDIFRHLQRLSFSYYDNTNTGKLMSRIVTDLLNVSEIAHHGPEDIFISLLIILGSFIILFNINVKLTVILLFIILFMIYFLYVHNKKLKFIFKKYKENLANINAQIQDSLSGIRVVKSFCNEPIEERKFEIGNKEFLKNREICLLALGKLTSTNGFFQGILYTSVILFGGIFINWGSLKIADLIVYILYINIFLNPINKIINFIEQYQDGIAGFERFLEVMHIDPDIVNKKDAIELKNPRGEIQFKNVSFSYDNTNNILKNINIKIESRKTVAIVGPSGNGKTTICSIIPRFYDINEGSVMIDGIDIRNITLKSLRDNIGVVQQDAYIFSETIKENISYGNPGATNDEIIEAAKRANAHEFIIKLQYGYNTYIGERGVKLSGGQKQRICIARVFLKNPPILILDEATSALDNENEKLIQKSIEALSKNRTTIIIAHRLSTIRNVDEILVLNDGEINERGTHNELVNNKGEYMRFYNMQFNPTSL